MTGLPFRQVGVTTPEPTLAASLGGRALLSADLDAIEAAFKTPIDGGRP